MAQKLVLNIPCESFRRVGPIEQLFHRAGLPVTTPYESPEAYHVYHQYTIRAPQRDALAAYLKERGIGTMIYYPAPLHLQALYAGLDYGEGSPSTTLHFGQAQYRRQPFTSARLSTGDNPSLRPGSVQAAGLRTGLRTAPAGERGGQPGGAVAADVSRTDGGATSTGS